MKQILRAWRNQPLFIVVVLAILALGVGSTTAMFSLVYGVLLRPFPFDGGGRLVMIRTESAQLRGAARPMSLPDFEDLRRENRQFESMGAYQEDRFSLVENGSSLPVRYARITPDLFPTLGIQPVLGRNFDPSDDQPGGDANRVILSHGFWKQHYAGDPGIVGKTIRTSFNSLTVAGVMPEGFRYPDDIQMWIPIQSLLQIRKINRRDGRQYRRFQVVAKLRPGATLESARVELDQFGKRMEAAYPITNEGMRPRPISLRDAAVGDVRPYLWLLFASVLLVLCICTANAANLFLVRASARMREFTIRSALGASSGAILWSQLKESLMLAAAGGALGAAFARLLLELFGRVAVDRLPAWIEIRMDEAALAFCMAAALAAGAIFGLLPALMASRVNLGNALKDGARGSASAGGIKKALVIGEVALAAVLLISSGLLLRTLQQLQRVELGFDPNGLTTIQITPFVPGEETERIRLSTAYFQRVVERIRRIPGVVAVGGTDGFPFSEAYRTGRPTLQMETKGELKTEALQRTPSALIDVTPDYFEAMRIPLLEGRKFRDTDDLDAPYVIILSERAAQTLFPGRPALGQQVRTNTAGATDPWATVIGVVGNVKYRATDAENSLEFYYPYKQYGLSTTRLAIRTAGPRPGLEREVRAAVQSVDSQTPIEDVRPMNALIAETLWQQRLWSTLLTAFAASALLLSLVGLYGVLAFSVNQRIREIGIRMALGAAPGQVLSLVVAEGIRLVSAGLILGLGGALALSRWLTSLLFNVSWLDPWTYGVICILLIFVGLLAAALPAWRAAHVDPTAALRAS